MNGSEQIKQTWRRSEACETEVQQRIWDNTAERYRELPIPDLAENDFLAELTRHILLTPSVRTLDVGCGSGVYSLALASRAGEAVGVDISPQMIGCARERSAAMGLKNTRFHCVDWAAADIDALGFRGAFDVVFAHMTPAIDSYETLDKLYACSKNLCMLEKFARRRNQIQDEAFRAAGIDTSEEQYHGDVLQVFTYLWYRGCCPQLFYHDEAWDDQRPTENMAAWCTDRARLRKRLTPCEEAAIRDYVQGQAVDGMVREHTTATRVTVVWNVR